MRTLTEDRILAREWIRTGVYRGMDDLEYHAIDACSHHRMMEFERSPAHLRWSIDHPSESSDSMTVGTAAHFCTMQPELFDRKFIVASNCSAITGKGEHCTNQGSKLSGGKWFCGTHLKAPGETLEPGTRLLKADQFASASDTAAAVWAHPIARRILEATPPEDRETTIIWRHEETGILCKTRLDLLADALGMCVDLKTADNASPEEWQRAGLRYGYHRQAAWYLEALRSTGRQDFIFGWIVAETEPPFGVTIHEADDELIGLAADENRNVHLAYAECVRANRWPSYPQIVNTFSPPHWMKKQAAFAAQNGEL
jgi:hypothetical protein